MPAAKKTDQLKAAASATVINNTIVNVVINLGSNPGQAITVQANAALPIQYKAGQLFPLEILLPMHLISYNNNLRKLLLYGQETSLPAAIVAWLLQSTQYKSLFTVTKPA